MRLFGSAILALALCCIVGLVGCGKKGTEGGGKGDGDGKAGTFKVSVPSGTTDVTQGDDTEVTIELVEMSEDFSQPVTVKIADAKGLKIDPSEFKLKKDSASQKVMIAADEKAEAKEHVLDVTATPEKGDASKVKMKVKVNPKE